uniref:Uncharacterized protein LOC104240482 n=1 Tax=Nicotiana sylvestris TaxID=4096 RepID=A0A1U7Y4B7_NICSY|nr:PREDICTED: uncharacterized protein LOC104240482 [Nicotiana sylvestris]
MAFESEPFNSQSVGSNALNPMHMVSLLDYIVLLQHKACKQTSSEIASVVQTDNSVTYVSKSSTFESWFIDSGASNHISGTKSLFTTISNSQSLPTVTMANGSQTTATAIGQARPLPSLPLDLVLYIPGLGNHLDIFEVLPVPSFGDLITISHSSSSIAPVTAPPPIASMPPPSPVPPPSLSPPTIAPVPSPSPVQPSIAPPLLTYHCRLCPASGPIDSCPAPDPANTADLSPLSQSIALRKGEALSHPGWQQAMIDEMSDLHTSGTWELVPLPSSKSTVGCRWIDTFSPVAKIASVRLFLSMAAVCHWPLYQLDIKNNFFMALVSSWKNGNTMPFIFDTVWDLIKLADYLTLREDVDPSNIGITGESLGGMHAWFAAFVDTRYSVVVPIIGVQGFQWAIEHDKWQARVNSIKAVFDARADLDKSTIDKEVVQKVWDRIAPGFSSQFDSPYTVPIIAPRPFLILNGEDDPRSPLGGLKIPESRAHKAYEEANCPRDFKAFIAFAMRQAQLTIAFVIQGSHSRSFSPRSLRVRVE